MKRIVFVCSGNICRSPMAAGIGRAKLEAAEIPHVIISAGTLNIQGQPASKNAIEAARLAGVDITGHRSQGASTHLLRLSDHIVVMSPGHEDAILRAAPELAPKIVRLWEYAEPIGSESEIFDPVGLDLDKFIVCRELIDRAMDAWIRRLIALS